jgi:Lrp/AsnC family transcriptional regulator for asnA, asnC and gidA
MFDATDRKILLALRQNGRLSHVQLARDLDLNVSTVARRIEDLLAQEIIRIQAVPNPYQFGYNAHAFITLDVDLIRVESVAGRLARSRNVSLLNTSFGRFDILMVVDFPDWEMLQAFVKEELSHIEGIRKVETFLVSEIKKRYRGLFTSTPPNSSLNIDDIDRRLVEELEKNGRASYAELAEKFGVSLATISRRLAALLDNNIIRIVAVPNPSRLGYLANAYIAFQVQLEKIEQVCQILSADPAVHLVMTMMNGFEVLAGVNFPGPEMLYKFITAKIAAMDGVTNIETFIRAEIKKATYAHLDLDNLEQ